MSYIRTLVVVKYLARKIIKYGMSSVDYMTALENFIRSCMESSIINIHAVINLRHFAITKS